MPFNDPFFPESTQTLAVTTAAASVQLRVLTALQGGAKRQVRVVAPSANSGPVFFAVGKSGVTATVATGTPVLPGTTEKFSLPGDATYISAILGTGTGTLYLTLGDGV